MFPKQLAMQMEQDLEVGWVALLKLKRVQCAELCFGKIGAVPRLKFSKIKLRLNSVILEQYSAKTQIHSGVDVVQEHVRV